MSTRWKARCHFLHEVFEHSFYQLACFHDLTSTGYRRGREPAWLVRKPTHLHFDEEGRLHSEIGMCLQYRDGWGFDAWHGQRVPGKLILYPEALTKQEWRAEKNLEMRRVIQERIGAQRFLEMVGGTCIDEGRRENLIEIDLDDDPEKVAHYVHVKDASTPRQYYLRVPPQIKHADEAVAWTFGMGSLDYHPLSRDVTTLLSSRQGFLYYQLF